MTTYVLIFMLLTPNGSISVRAEQAAYTGADLCLAKKEVLDAALKAQVAKGEVFGFSSYCLDSKMHLGVPA